MRSSLHFVGFKNERVYTARRVFGMPDFYHRHWDRRAVSMVIPGDVVVFADGDETQEPKLIAFDDSQMQ